MSAQALLPVGRSCDCGHPLVWRHGKLWCSVYGSHPTTIHYRDRTAPFAALVDLASRTRVQLEPGEHHRLRPSKRPATGRQGLWDWEAS